MANIEPRFNEFKGDNPVVFVISSNLERRHLKSGQKAAIAGEEETD